MKTIGPLLELALDLPAPGSRRLQQALLQQLRAAIVSGRLAPGLRLPATRALAQQFGIGRQTVVAVYELLLAEGYLEARTGAGSFVAKGLRRPVRASVPEASVLAGQASRHGRSSSTLGRSTTTGMGPSGSAASSRSSPSPSPLPLDFRMGLPDVAAFPFDLWRRLNARTLRRFAKAPLERAPAAGMRELREAIALQVSVSRAVAAPAEAVVVTAGAQQALHLIARTLVAQGRRIVAVEDPGFPPVRDAFQAAGARVLPVAVDAEGLCVDQLPAQAQVVCVTPSHQYPYGVPMSAARRQALLDIARRRDALLIEDDYDAEFRFEGRALDALKTLDHDDRVLYIGTFSKSLFPALRIGYVIAPQALAAALADARENLDGHGPLLDQLTLAAFITEGHLARHVRRMQKQYAARRQAVLAGLRPLSDWLRPLPSHAGLHLSAAAAPGLDLDELARRARAQGLGLYPLQRYAHSLPVPPGLGFGYGAIDVPRIHEAMRLLARLLGA